MRRRGFEELTPPGQLRRLRELAFDALGAYDLGVRRVTYVARAFNAIFRVDTMDGTAFALRISPGERIHAPGCEELEAAWTQRIRRDTGLSVPRVIPTRDGSPVVWSAHPAVPEARSCVLFEWVGGRPLRERLGTDLVHKAGAATAIVHRHGAADASAGASGSGVHASAGASGSGVHASAGASGSGIDASAGASGSGIDASAGASAAPRGALVADRVLYLRVGPRLEELRPRYGSVLTDAVDRAQLVLDELWRHPPHPPHLLHGDVQPGNVMVKRGAVTLIDFQDLIWGFEIQDALIALRAFDYFADAAALLAAFRAGYETVRPWPEAGPQMCAALRAARHLNILNFGLGVRRPGRDEFVARHAEPVAAWMRNEPHQLA